MKLFASRTPAQIEQTNEDFSFHVCDYMHACDNYGYPADRVAKNPPNAILELFRDAAEAWGPDEHVYLAGMWLAEVDQWNIAGEMQMETTVAEVIHAERVLQKFVGVYDVPSV